MAAVLRDYLRRRKDALGAPVTIPLRFVVSAKTIAQKGVEFKAREAGTTEIVAMDEVVRFVLAAK